MEFHRYAQVIPGHCNERGFGPPLAFTPTSTCSWIGHPVSGLWPLTRRPIQTRSRFAFGTEYLKLATYHNSPDRSTKSTRSPLNGLSVLVSTRFQVLFHSPPGVLFTFPSRYCFSIGHQVVFRLGRWSSRFPTGFPVSRGTLDPDRMTMTFAYGPLTLYGGLSQVLLLTIASP